MFDILMLFYSQNFSVTNTYSLGHLSLLKSWSNFPHTFSQHRRGLKN